MRDLKINVNLYKVLFDRYQAGLISDEYIENFFETKKKYIESKVQQLQQALEQAGDTLTPRERQWVDNALSELQRGAEILQQQEEKFYEEILGSGTKPSNTLTKLHMEIKKFPGGLRRLVYDLIDVDKNQINDRAQKQLAEGKFNFIILVDDNIDTDKTILDAYRILYKSGLVNGRNSKIVGAALHKLQVTNQELMG